MLGAMYDDDSSDEEAAADVVSGHPAAHSNAVPTTLEVEHANRTPLVGPHEFPVAAVGEASPRSPLQSEVSAATEFAQRRDSELSVDVALSTMAPQQQQQVVRPPSPMQVAPREPRENRPRVRRLSLIDQLPSPPLMEAGEAFGSMPELRQSHEGRAAQTLPSVGTPHSSRRTSTGAATLPAMAPPRLRSASAVSARDPAATRSKNNKPPTNQSIVQNASQRRATTPSKSTAGNVYTGEAREAKPMRVESREKAPRARSASRPSKPKVDTKPQEKDGCLRSAQCGCERCAQDCKRFGLPAAPPHVSEADWRQLPDAVLLQAVVLLGPAEVCAIVCACSTWVETVTASETWLWSKIGGAGLAADVFALLERWATAAGTNVRSALQLWLVRPHLWGCSSQVNIRTRGAKPSVTNRDACEIVTAPMLDDMSCLCCAAWMPDGQPRAEAGDTLVSHTWAEESGLVVGTARGFLSFNTLAADQSPASGLRGMNVTSIEPVSLVRSAHGQSLVTALEPLAAAAQRVVVSAGLDGLLRIWSPQGGTELHQVITEHSQGINSLSIAEVGGLALSCGDDRMAFVYDLSAMRPGSPPMCRFEGHTAGVYCTQWLAPTVCATGGFDRRALCWDTRAPAKPTAVLQAYQHVYSVMPLSGNRSPHNLVTAQADGAITRWDLRNSSKGPLQDMRGHSAPVEGLALLPGNVLASCSADGTLRLWDMAHGGDLAWTWRASVPLTGVKAISDDTLLTVGCGLPPTLLSLNYAYALPCLAEVLGRRQMTHLKPWKRGQCVNGTTAPPEGIGRHSNLRQTMRQRRSSTRGSIAAEEEIGYMTSSMRGPFDRCTKSKTVPLGSTGTSHRQFLSGLRG